MKFSKGTAYGLHALMYMVRHITQLPVGTETIAKAEGVPPGYLAKIFQKLVKAKLIKSVKGGTRGYIFSREPEKISLLELFESIEGKPLFDGCLLSHCQCGGTVENCYIYAQWRNSTENMTKVFSEISLASVAWSHPEHRFYALPESLCNSKKKIRKKRK